METRVGKVTHYYNRIAVAVLELMDHLELGDEIHILGHTTDFSQKVTSMEVDHQPVQAVGPGDDVAIKVSERVRKGDAVFKVAALHGE